MNNVITMTGSQINNVGHHQISNDLMLVIFPDGGLVRLITGRYKSGAKPSEVKMGMTQFADPDLEDWFWIRCKEDPFIELSKEESKQISDLLNITVKIEIEDLPE